MKRSAGILMPIFSLPSAYGIGSLGREARAFVDFLRASGQSWWQVLPVGPTAAGDSPYSSESTFAGSPLLIDLEELAAQGLLTRAELEQARVPDAPAIDYAAVRRSRDALLRRAFARIPPETAQAVRDFRDTTPWLRAHALYQALKGMHHGAPWSDWPDEALRRYDAAAVARAEAELAAETAYQACLQYWFFRQWKALREYANANGVGIIGDLPIYVAMDSADVWSERKEFLLDGQGLPAQVAGVPPDYFAKDGQLWGNPLYDWAAMKADGFGWWIRRVEGATMLFDAIRIDHFRAFAAYWAVPREAKTAKEGAWEQGPGMDLLRVLTGWFYGTTYIAEDLGILTDEVHRLREESGLPGMKVLEFAFSDPGNAYLPHNYPENCVCYTGTHDNDTLRGWYDHAEEAELAFARQYLGAEGEELCRAVLLAGQRSVARLFVAQLQDYMGLGSQARINCPGVAEGNWRWRLDRGALTPELAADIHTMTYTFGRCGK